MLVEAPSTVNALQRFNLYPEVRAGAGVSGDAHNIQKIQLIRYEQLCTSHGRHVGLSAPHPNRCVVGTGSEFTDRCWHNISTRKNTRQFLSQYLYLLVIYDYFHSIVLVVLIYRLHPVAILHSPALSLNHMT